MLDHLVQLKLCRFQSLKKVDKHVYDCIVQCHRASHRILDRRNLMDRITRQRRETVEYWNGEGI